MRTDAPVIAALMTVVAAHGRWGFWKCFDRLRMDGRRWNHKRVHRVYCALRLNLPRRIKRRVPTRLRQPLQAPPMLNETWALDYVTDSLYSGQRFRALTILDEGNREGLAIEVATSIPSPRVVRVLEDLVALHGRPRALRTDNGLPQKSRRQSFSDLTRVSAGTHHANHQAVPPSRNHTLTIVTQGQTDERLP